MPAAAPRPRPIPFRKPGRTQAVVRLAKVLRAEAVELKGEVNVTLLHRPRTLPSAA